jgi:hypothetical protein
MTPEKRAENLAVQELEAYITQFLKIPRYLTEDLGKIPRYLSSKLRNPCSKAVSLLKKVQWRSLQVCFS